MKIEFVRRPSEIDKCILVIPHAICPKCGSAFTAHIMQRTNMMYVRYYIGFRIPYRQVNRQYFTQCENCGIFYWFLDKTYRNIKENQSADFLYGECRKILYRERNYARQRTDRSEKNTWLAALLAFFGGGYGLQHVYMGHWTRFMIVAVLDVFALGMFIFNTSVALDEELTTLMYLISCLVFGINGCWGIIDMIRILTGNAKDGHGKYIMTDKQFQSRVENWNMLAKTDDRGNRVYCRNCGNKVADGANFCSKCGYRVISERFQNYGALKKSKVKKKWPMIIVLVILLIIMLTFLSVPGVKRIRYQSFVKAGNRYLAEMNYEEAVVAFTKAIRVESKEAAAYYERGNAYVGLADQAETADDKQSYYLLAEKDYLAALDLDETMTDAEEALSDVDLVRKNLPSKNSNFDYSSSGVGFVDFVPLSAADVTWVIEPEYDYQCVVPLRGNSFSDIEGDYSDGQTAIFRNVMCGPYSSGGTVAADYFYEMSFPGYSNLPQYYQIQLADGSWRLYFMPDHSDSGDIPMDQDGMMSRFDASGIINEAGFIGADQEHPSQYICNPVYPSPWYLFTLNSRGMGGMDIYYDVRTKQALAVGNFYDTFITPVKKAGLHKPYPSGRINTEGIYINDDETMSIAEGSELIEKFYPSIYSTIEEYPKGYVDTNGQLITDFIYTAAEDFSEGIAACSRDGRWGYIDENGNEITEFIYDGVWAYPIDHNYNSDSGEWEYEMEYAAYPCTSDTMVVRRDGEVGLLYRSGQTLIVFGEFEDMAPAYNDELWAKKDGLWGLIDLADAKQKAGISSVLTVPADTEIPDSTEYTSYIIDEHPEVMPFDYPSKESEIYEFYQDVNEFQNTTVTVSMYTSPDGEKEIVTIPAGETVYARGIIQRNPGWICVEWNVVTTKRTYYGSYYSENEYVKERYYGWVLEENLSPYSNSVPNSVYQDILKQYRALCQLTENVWNSKEYYEEQYPEVNILAVSKYQRGSGNIYYAYYDINGDGYDELLMGQGQLQTGEITLTDILTYDENSSLISLNYYDGRSGGYIGDRADARLSDDGTIILFNSSSAFHSHYQFINVSGSGYEKTGKEYDQDTRERPDATYFDGNGYITKAQMQAILDGYNYLSNDSFDWILLAEEKENPC